MGKDWIDIEIGVVSKHPIKPILAGYFENQLFENILIVIFQTIKRNGVIRFVDCLSNRVVRN